MHRKLAITIVLAVIMFASGAYAMTGAEVLKAVNHDNDQTLEMPEAIAAAAAVFDGLSQNKGQSVNRSEISDRVTESDWSRVNKDHDQTLELDEWLTIARTRFEAADTNHDGKLDARELDAAPGQSLVKMIIK